MTNQNFHQNLKDQKLILLDGINQAPLQSQSQLVTFMAEMEKAGILLMKLSMLPEEAKNIKNQLLRRRRKISQRVSLML
jgi:hypothetical protein